MKRLLLIDGDIIAYRAAFVAEQAVEWEPGQFSLTANEEAAQLDFVSRIDAICTMLGSKEFRLAFTNAVNFRKTIYPDYKSHRNDVRKPMLLNPLRDFALERWGDKVVYDRPGLEGDDCLGILATTISLKQYERILVSIDKDFMQVPGKHFNFLKPDEGVVEIDAATANYNHMLQTLTGDVSDGYPGCPGIGPARAKKMLMDVTLVKDIDLTYEVMWPVVVKAFIKAGKTEADAVTMAQVARICRAGNYDWTTKQPIPWRPPTCKGASSASPDSSVQAKAK